MRLIPHLAAEFGELCAEYASVDQQGKDIVALVKMFGNEYDHLRLEIEPDFVVAWETFLREHQHQATVVMIGMVLHTLITYWEMGPMLFDSLPTLENMLVRDTAQEISEEIERRSAVNGNAVVSE